MHRRPATARETKALGHPLRLRILRLCREGELTNKQLADRLGKDPGTVLHHVRQLVEAGLLEQAPVRTGPSGALEKPYRTAVDTWWLDGPLESEGTAARHAPIEAFEEELREAGPESVRLHDRFVLHLDAEDVTELERRILAVLDDYIETDDDRQRQGRPAIGGLFLLHQLAD